MSKLDSTFGPLGKSKIVCNEAGSILLTKDSHLLLPLYLATTLSGRNSSDTPTEEQHVMIHGSSVMYHLYCELMKSCGSMGDGLHTNMIIANSLVRSVLTVLDSTHTFRTQRRIRLLHSAQLIQHVCRECRDEITIYMIRCHAWHREGDISKWFQTICTQTALPSSTVVMTNNILRMMNEWVLAPIDDHLSQQSFATVSDKRMQHKCILLDYIREIWRWFDLLVYISPSAEDAVLSGGVSGSMLPSHRLLPPDSVLLSGRCRDFSAWIHRPHREDRDDDDDGAFICIRELLLSPSNGFSAEYVVSVGSLDEFESRVDRVGVEVVHALVGAMRRRGICLLMTHCKVEDRILNEFATNGLYTIDCIPVNQLSYLARVSKCKVFSSARDFLLACPSDTIEEEHVSLEGMEAFPAGPHPQCQGGRGCGQWSMVGEMRSMERVLIGTLQSKAVHLLLGGLRPQQRTEHRRRGEQCVQRVVPQQLVLCGGSSLTNGCYVSVLKRCFQTVLYALQHGGSQCPGDNPTATLPSVDDGDNNNYDDDDDNVDDDSSSDCMDVVPGGGAAELGWSILWEQVAKQLHVEEGRSCDGIHVVGEATVVGSYEERIRNLVTSIASRIGRRIVALNPLALPECIALCAIISQSYLEIPRLLMDSARGVIVLAAPGAYVDADAAASVQQWRDTFVRGVPDLMAIGRVGVVVHGVEGRMDCNGDENDDDFDIFRTDKALLLQCTLLNAAPICSLSDAVDCGVYGSTQQFWQIFRNALEVLLMYLRLDGDSGLIYVRSSKRRSKTTTDRSRAAADSDESGDDSAVTEEQIFY